VRAMTTGDYSTALAQMRAARASYERAGDMRAQAMVMGNIAYLHMVVGHYQEASDLLRLVGAVALRLGLQHTVAGVRHNQGLALARIGKLAEAEEAEREAVEMLTMQGNHRVGAGARSYLAGILLQRGDIDAAEREARAAVESPNPSPSVRALALATLSEVQLALGDARAALGSAEKAWALVAEQTDENEAYVLLSLLRALRACGEQARLLTTSSEARSRLQARAARITDPSLRASFLEQVPENAATRAMADELLGTT